MSDQPNLFGWEILLKSVEHDIKNNSDILLCFTHLVLVSTGFKCIGLGESRVVDGTETKTETLPNGWNDVYTLRYMYQGRLYILKCVKISDSMMVNFFRVDERTTSSLQLKNASVAERTGTLEHMIPSYSEIATLVRREVIDKIVSSKKSRESASQTDAFMQARAPIEVPHRYSDPSTMSVMDPMPGPTSRPLGVGELDLHPFGRNPLAVPSPLGVGGGGGMLYEPQRGPGGMFGGPGGFGMPPGAVPPGARFDPFRPPDVDRFPRRPNDNRPDNDEMPPPGYDDMFM